MFRYVQRAAMTAVALDSPWKLRVGPVAVLFDSEASVEVKGAPIPDADIDVKNNVTLGAEIGYDLTPDLTARLAIGIPPTTTLSASGSLTGFVPPLSGTLGRVKYGPAVLSLTHAFGDPGGWRPYVGAGVTYTVVFASRDRDVASLDFKNAWGTAIQAGLDIPIDAHWSALIDLRKVFLKMRATETLPALGGPPAEADLTLDPSLVHAGIGYRC